MALTYMLVVLVVLTSALIKGVSAANLRHSVHNKIGDVLKGTTFEQYKSNFGKVYASEVENSWRSEIFVRNVALIQTHNLDSSKTYEMGINQFTDMTHEEMDNYKGLLTGGSFQTASARTRASLLELEKEEVDLESLPKDVDWRKKIPGWGSEFSQVKNQGACGSCWAFAAASVLEAYTAKEFGVGVELSKEQLVDCTDNPRECGGTGGCSGATSELAYAHVMKHGVMLGKDMKYHDSGFHYCHDVKLKNKTTELFKEYAVQIGGFELLPSNKYAPIMKHIATHGPLTIAVDAQGWFTYHGGIFDPAHHFKDAKWYDSDAILAGHRADIDHAVVLAGYGTEDGLDYWLVRNSWGPMWGEHGHIRIKRNGIMEESTNCYQDDTPCDGIACKGECKTPIRVCGNSGMLYWASYPYGLSKSKRLDDA